MISCIELIEMDYTQALIHASKNYEVLEEDYENEMTTFKLNDSEILEFDGIRMIWEIKEVQIDI